MGKVLMESHNDYGGYLLKLCFIILNSGGKMSSMALNQVNQSMWLSQKNTDQ